MASATCSPSRSPHRARRRRRRRPVQTPSTVAPSSRLRSPSRRARAAAPTGPWPPCPGPGPGPRARRRPRDRDRHRPDGLIRVADVEAPRRRPRAAATPAAQRRPAASPLPPAPAPPRGGRPARSDARSPDPGRGRAQDDRERGGPAVHACGATSSSTPPTRRARRRLLDHRAAPRVRRGAARRARAAVPLGGRRAPSSPARRRSRWPWPPTGACWSRRSPSPTARDAARARRARSAPSSRPPRPAGRRRRTSAVANGSLSNLGGLGVDRFQALRHAAAGQRAVARVDRGSGPVAVPGGVGLALTVTAGLTVDHRVGDGAHAAQLLDRRIGHWRPRVRQSGPRHPLCDRASHAYDMREHMCRHYARR